MAAARRDRLARRDQRAERPRGDGGAPVGVLIALSLPPSWRDAIDALADGLGAAARAAGARSSAAT
jgi:hypothetical protein